MKILLVEPLEPPVFSRTPVFSQEFIVGSHSVLPTPPPTTIAGLIGFIHGVSLEEYSNLDHMDLLGKLVEELKNCERPLVKGPIVWFKGVSDKPYICLSNVCAPVKMKEDGFEIAYEEFIKPIIEERVGVKLVRGYGGEVAKIIDKGYMYRYSTIRYVRESDGTSVNPTFVYKFNCTIDVKPNVHRVGGESRMARVEVVDQESMPGDIVKVLENLENPIDIRDGDLHIAITPIPLIPLAEDKPQLVLGTIKPNVLGLEFVEEIVGIIPLKRDVKPKRKIERLSLGYSEVLEARRPQILALPTGTIVKTRKPPASVEKALETLWNIGMPTLLKL